MRQRLILMLGLLLCPLAAHAEDPFQSNAGPPAAAPAPHRSAVRPAPERERPEPVPIPAPALPAANRFDGRWAVFVACPQAADGAMPFSWSLSADVRNGLLHGQFRNPGEAPSMSLDGPIQPDGSAQFAARGLSGVASYNITHAARGSAFSHTVTARLEPARGSGTWTAGRVCNLTFTKQ